MAEVKAESFCDFGVGTAEPSSFSNVLTSDPAFEMNFKFSFCFDKTGHEFLVTIANRNYYLPVFLFSFFSQSYLDR